MPKYFHHVSKNRKSIKNMKRKGDALKGKLKYMDLSKITMKVVDFDKLE